MSVKKVATELVNEFVNPAESLQQIVSADAEYKIIAEQEQTKRREIDAWEKKAITKINT